MPINELPRNLTKLLTFLQLAVLTAGCDDRASQIAREAADRQAEQNKTMTELHDKVADGSRKLVDADAQARREMVGVHRDLQAERKRLDSDWRGLEAERRQTASERRTESLLVPLLETAGVAVLTALALGFAWYALAAARHSEPAEAELNELLLRELLSDELALLPGPPGQSKLLEPPQPENSSRD